MADSSRSPETEPGRLKDRLLGIGIIAVAFGITLGISFWARAESGPEVGEEPPPPSTDGIPGWPSAVDPVLAIPAAAKMTPRYTFRGLHAAGVKSDGTVDLTNKGSRVRYAFQSAAGKGPQPPRPVGTLPKRTYCGKQNVHLKEVGVVADPDVPAYPCAGKWKDGLSRTPACGPKQVWKRAIEKGADDRLLARIQYYRSAVGPAWRFEIPGTKHRFSIYGDCGRELDAGEAIGTVP